MFERRSLLGVLGCLTLVLTIWQITPRDESLYREWTIPYLPTGGPAYGASAMVSPRQSNRQRIPLLNDGDDNALHGGRRTTFEVAGEDIGPHIGGTPGSYLNFSGPDWLVAAAAAVAAAGTHSPYGGVGVEELSGHGARGSGSTQSIASLTVASLPGEPLPKDDYTSLIDLKDFRFLINYDYCGGVERNGGSIGSDVSRRRRSIRSRRNSLKRGGGDALRGTWTTPSPSPPLVLVLIHSAPANLVKRNTIRTTWGRPDRRARLIFLMGAVNSSAAQQEIEQESRVYDDIVQGNFVDAYRNMTYKHVMALKWAHYHCAGARYVLKTDDDVFINTPALYDVLEWVAPQQNLLLCQLVTKLIVKRTHRSKWFVSWREYPDKYYPPHCPGYSILYSPDMASKLYREAQRLPFFWIDDVHITGTVAQNVNATITPMDGLYLNDAEKFALLHDDARSGSGGHYRTVFFFTNPNLPMAEIRQLWRAVSNERR